MFTEYIAKDRILNELKFDFIIANETGKSWYDGSPDQYMPERAWCLSKIKPGMTIVDCGAHHGMMSVVFSLATGPSGRVISFEALSSNADVIRRNAELNGLTNIEANGFGVSDVNAEFPINNNESNTIVISSGKAPGNEFIKVVRLDDVIPHDIKIDFLKIDVEGHDVQAMRGMKRIIDQKPYIDLEIHNFIFDNIEVSLQEIKSMLKGYDFTVLGEIFGELKEFGSDFPMKYISHFDNPHLFCTPKTS